MGGVRFTRRRFLGALVSSLAAFFAPGRGRGSNDTASSASLQAGTLSNPTPRIVISRDERVLGEGGTLHMPVLERMLDGAMEKLTGIDAAGAWKSLFSPDDVVGIKLNCLAGRGLSPHPELVDLIVRKLTSSGVDEKHIIVWDRTDRDLKKAGFTIRRNGEGYRCYGTNGDYNPDELEFAGSVGSIFSPIISKQATSIVNVPVLKDHDLAGVTLSMKSFYGAIHNPNKYHDNHCNPYVADLNSHPYVRNKVRLVVTDALVAQYHGGPSFKPQFCWDYAGLIVARDQVAHDRIGWAIIEKKRKEAGLQSLAECKREPLYIMKAGELGLGESDVQRIEVIET